jgi:signal peptide peptidase SppA
VDFKVASSIYRKPWLIESQAALAYIDLLEQIKAGKAVFSKPKSNYQKLFAGNPDVIEAPSDRWSAKEHPGYDGKSIAVLRISGPLMKEDYCGAFGTTSLRNVLNQINQAESVKTIVLHVDSPGGQVDGTEALANAIAASDKEVIALADGMIASAAYWIASAADRIIATSNTDIIGSIGTMISFYDRSQQMEDNGLVLREYYADASKDKNKMIREAMDGNGKLLVQQLLNPTNDLFLAAVKNNRGEKLNEKETLSGKTFLSQQALENGLIDEISSFDKTINNLTKKHQKTTVNMKWKALDALLAAAFTINASKKVELEEAQVDQIEGSINDLNSVKAENGQLKTKVSELETAAATAQTEKDALQAQVTALTTKKTELEAEVTRLGNLDAGKITSVSGDKDKSHEPAIDAAQMEFQQELNSKI